jgi:hypothetical protein
VTNDRFELLLEVSSRRHGRLLSSLDAEEVDDALPPAT